ncbi:MAG: hypothetical protein J3R72DRAFT_398754 [Linnemannia gamsii]|nr:MAG: hypothetical protein J3R72DRAFT_398754 [Linnemannia gamsii]
MRGSTDDATELQKLDRLQQEAWYNFRRARTEAEDAFEEWAGQEDHMRQLRATKYAFLKISKTAQSHDTTPLPPRPLSIPTWRRPCVEDRTENIRIEPMLQEMVEGQERWAIGVLADDPGLVTLQESTTQTLSDVVDHIRQYEVLTSNRFELLSVINDIELPKEPEDQEYSSIHPPPTMRITASQINDLSFSHKHAKDREKTLRANTETSEQVRLQYELLSQNPLTTATTLQQIDNAQEIRRNSREVLRPFENNNKRQKQRKIRRLRTSRTYATLAAEQRRAVKESVTSIGQNPKSTIVPIVLHGAAGTSVGSRIKGHTKRGGRKITHQHRQHCIVGLTNENRTSRICSACYRPIFLMTAKRVKDGSIKTVRLHGAVQCRYKDCPRYKAGRPTQGRDANSAINIATAGASSLLSVNNTVLPPFRPFSLPSPPTNNARAISGTNQPIATTPRCTSGTS